MIKFLIFILMLILLSPISFASTPVKIIQIYDGDTMEAKLESGNKFSIRLKGIDCYETSKIHRAYKQAYINKLDIEEVIKKGNEAKTYLENLYKKSSVVSFDFMGIDKYERVLGVLYFDNLNVNEELLKNNLCVPYVFKE